MPAAHCVPGDNEKPKSLRIDNVATGVSDDGRRTHCQHTPHITLSLDMHAADRLPQMRLASAQCTGRFMVYSSRLFMKTPLHRNKDFLAGLMFILVGGSAVIIARDYPFGSALRMGPGYF